MKNIKDCFPACGKNTARLLDRQLQTLGYTFYKCYQCNLIFSEPMKNTGRTFYEDESWYYKVDKLVDSPRLWWSQRMFLYDKILPSGSLLDIGCGTGLFIHTAQKHGYNVSGIDFDRKAIEKAKNVFHLEKVYPMTLEEFIQKTTEKFNIVTFFEVLEHLENPYIFLQLVKTILKDKGYIALSIPNRERSLDTFTEMDLPPDHLTHWNENAIRYLLSILGFRIIKLEKSIKKEDFIAYSCIRSSLGIVKKQIKSVRVNFLPTTTLFLLRFFSRYKTFLLYFIGSILFWIFFKPQKQSSNIYVLSKLEK